MKEDLGFKNGTLADTNFEQLSTKEQVQILIQRNQDSQK